MVGKLNLVKQFRAFARKNKGELKASAVALYFAILSIANEASHDGGVNQAVYIDNERLMKMAGLGSARTLAIHRKILQDKGLIEYEAGGKFVEGKRISGKYTLKKLY